eukprot:128864-Pyramimonas_sp.AAC.3
MGGMDGGLGGAGGDSGGEGGSSAFSRASTCTQASMPRRDVRHVPQEKLAKKPFRREQQT